MRDYRKRSGCESKRTRESDPAYQALKRKRGRERWARLRHVAIMAYGGYVCACCGVDEAKFLTIDHVFNDGAAHRKEIRSRGAQIYKWLKDHNYPPGFQILCMNCNHGKALNGGICPHKDNGPAKIIPLKQFAGV